MLDKKNNYKKGITLLEILIIISIIGVLIAVVFPSFSNIKENQVLKTAVSDVLSSLDKARSQTLSSLDSSEYGVRFQSDSVIIFKGTVYSALSPDNEVVSIVPPASITNVNLAGFSGSSGEMYFNRLTGSPSKTGTITVSSTNFTKTITISATGSASSN